MSQGKEITIGFNTYRIDRRANADVLCIYNQYENKYSEQIVNHNYEQMIKDYIWKECEDIDTSTLNLPTPTIAELFRTQVKQMVREELEEAFKHLDKEGK